MLKRDVADYLPLKAAWLHILLALAEGSRHGYAIRASVEARSEGRVRLWPATLYGSIRDMVAEGLIEEVAGEPAPDDDPRRRYYDLTGFGREVLRAEVGRLARLVDAARAAHVVVEA